MPVAVESYITDFELTIQAHATRPINITRDFEIRLTDPNNRTFIPTFETHIDAVWPVTDAGGYGSWVRFKAGVTDPLMSIYSFPGSAEEMANSTYDNPRLYGSSQWMLDILATNPSNMSLAGEWLLEFRDLSPNDDARLNVTAAEIRVCWQQPGVCPSGCSPVWICVCVHLLRFCVYCWICMLLRVDCFFVKGPLSYTFLRPLTSTGNCSTPPPSPSPSLGPG